MKKIINGVIALVICMGIVSCGTDSGYTAENDNKTTTVTESEVVVPKYNTFNMSVEELVNKVNSSGYYSKTWSSDCTTQELADGKASFKTNNEIIGCNWSGTYEIATGNIIDIKISYPCDDNDAANGMVAGAGAEGVMEYLFNIDQDSAISEWFQASSVGNSGYVYGNYNICVRYNSANSAMETIITQKKELK